MGEGRVFTICNRRWRSAYLAWVDSPRYNLGLSNRTGREGRVERYLKHGLAVLVALSWSGGPWAVEQGKSRF